jgi:hypothetical protein
MAGIPTLTVTKWRMLSLKRLAYLSELRRTGQWQRHYATQKAFEEQLRAADADAEKWKQLAYASLEAAE